MSKYNMSKTVLNKTFKTAKIIMISFPEEDFDAFSGPKQQLHTTIP